ncbi:MAG: arsenate reductase ArsC [Candidatus Limnocylindria bacterium]
MEKQRVLFICTHNSARSQMAEGFLRALGGDRFEAFSAGMTPGEVRPEAIQVMAEVGIDISGQRSKSLDRYLGEPFTWVITVCDRARAVCPVFPGAEQAGHWQFDDPADAKGTLDERLAVFRRVRDEIRDRMRMFILGAGREDLPTPPASVLGEA